MDEWQAMSELNRVNDKEELRNILRRAEIKRVGERLTKKEVCNIYGLNYNFYMNCVIDRNVPSKKMAEYLEEYLNTPTKEIYEMVFASRKREEEFHEALKINSSEANELLQHLTQEDIFREPQA